MFKKRKNIAIENIVNVDYDTSVGVEAITMPLQDVDLSNLRIENKDLKQINNNLLQLNKNISQYLLIKNFMREKEY